MSSDALDAWEGLAESLESFRQALGRSTAVNVNTKSLRELAKSAVQQYFRVLRPELLALTFSDQDLIAVDTEMQGLLRLSNGRNSKRSYMNALATIRTLREDIEIRRELKLGQAISAGATDKSAPTSVEEKIVATLSELVPTAALSYRQVLLDLASTDRISLRGTANELREVLRETIDRLAPDEAVTDTPGFKFEPGRNAPTHKQKVRHILKQRDKGETARKAPEESVQLVDELTATVTRASYERGSISSHIQTTASEVRQMKMYVDSVLAELLEVHT